MSSIAPAQVTTEKKKPVRSCDGFVGREVDGLLIQTLLSTLQKYKATSDAFSTAFDFLDCWILLKGGSYLYFYQRNDGSFKFSSKYCMETFEASFATQKYCTTCSKEKKFQRNELYQ